MKALRDCRGCLQRLALQAAELATSDQRIKARAIEESLKILERDFSCDQVSIVIATKIHDVIKEVTQNPDPYREMKDKELEIARELLDEIRLEYGNELSGCLKLAVLGNAIDFFRPMDIIRMDMRGYVEFVIEDSKQLEAKLKSGGKVLYLADNAGEVFFDLPIVSWMKHLASVIYVVKAAPVQDDITLEDIRQVGMEAELEEIITTGTATPGVDFSLASAQFKHEFDTADLIFAKGMGYYESLSELPAKGKVFYCLKAKCQPVADSLGVKLGSYVAMIR